jgi:hypothetical protein
MQQNKAMQAVSRAACSLEGTIMKQMALKQTNPAMMVKEYVLDDGNSYSPSRNSTQDVRLNIIRRLWSISFLFLQRTVMVFWRLS